MNILEILNSGEVVFVEDEVEGKKIKSQVAAVNKNFTDMAAAASEFAQYAASQQNGEEHRRIVMAKSLRNYYPNWQALKVAYDNVAKEEQTKIASYNALKAKLIASLQTLAKESQKEAVVSLYDIFEGDFRRCEEGHEILILGAHNAQVIETMIQGLEEGLVVAGHFDEIDAQEIDANYTNVEKNVAMCKEKAQEMYGNKPGKLGKIEISISTMEEVGKKVVFFETYKNDLLSIGCPAKAIADYEKSFEKQYVPLKKSLQKELRFEFVEICDLVVDETSYQEADIENPAPVEQVLEAVTAVEAEPVELPEEAAEEVVTPAFENVVIDTNIEDIE